MLLTAIGWLHVHLWYRACKSLNFSQESIEKVVGKGMTKLLAKSAKKQEEKQQS